MVEARSILIVLLVVAAFLQTNFNPALGSFYATIGVTTFLVLFTDPKKTFRFGELNIKTVTSGLTLTMFFLLFSFILGFLFQNFSIAGAPELNLQTMLQVFAQAPVLEQNYLAKLFTFGLFIPIVETLAMLVLYEFSLDTLGKDKKPLAALLIMAGFMVFHLTVKGVTGNFQLAQTFAFAGFTIFAFEKWRIGAQGVFMHIVVNMSAMLISLNLLPAFVALAL